MATNRSNRMNRPGSVGAMLAVALCVVAGVSTAHAQIGPARRIEGAPVASEAVHARFAWGDGGNRIIWVNQADEVYYHRVHNNRVDPHIRMRGHTIGHSGDPTEYVIPWSRNEILVVTGQGNLYRHVIRSESIGPAEQIPGAPVGTQGQDPIFMFRIANRLINVTRQGEIWAHVIGNTVQPPQRLGQVAIAAPRVVRHVWNVGNTVYAVSDQGEVYAHDIHPNFGRGRLIASRSDVLGRPATRFVFILGTNLQAVNEQGTLWAHDIRALLPQRGGAAPAEGAAPPAQ